MSNTIEKCWPESCTSSRQGQVLRDVAFKRSPVDIRGWHTDQCAICGEGWVGVSTGLRVAAITCAYSACGASRHPDAPASTISSHRATRAMNPRAQPRRQPLRSAQHGCSSLGRTGECSDSSFTESLAELKRTFTNSCRSRGSVLSRRPRSPNSRSRLAAEKQKADC